MILIGKKSHRMCAVMGPFRGGRGRGLPKSLMLSTTVSSGTHTHTHFLLFIFISIYMDIYINTLNVYKQCVYIVITQVVVQYGWIFRV